MKLLTILLLIAASLGASESRSTDVFVGGTEGYPAYRIPSLVVSNNGTLLAFAEGRQSLADQAKNDIVLKRSNDGGTTWTAVRLIHDDGANSLNNPTALVSNTGRIFLVYQRIPAHLTEHSKDRIRTGYDGPDVYRTLLVTSDDDGATWSAPLDITRGTKRPEGATTIASGPGIGIQVKHGPHKGRLVIPFNEGPFGKWQNYMALSDDLGATWKCGSNVPGALIGERSQVNEVQVVELSDGTLRLNSRQFAGAKVRKTALSRDGGETWTSVEDVPALRDPSCMASVLRYSFDDGPEHKGCILYSGPDSAHRDTGTIRVSTDDGATWPIKKELWPGSFAYSVLTRLADDDVGCLFEADGCKRIRFARFPVDWITTPTKAESFTPEARTGRTGKFGWWMQRHEEKVAQSKSSAVELAFLGDSITEEWEKGGKATWDKLYVPRKAANYGFSGDSTQHVIWRLDHGEWEGIAPKVCVLLIGTNNVKHSQDTPEQIAMGIRSVLDRIHTISPKTKVLLLAILPRGANADDPLRQRCEAVNRHLPAFADGKRVYFLNVGSQLTQPDGTLNKDIAPDLLHLSAKGYELLAKAMEAMLTELLLAK